MVASLAYSDSPAPFPARALEAAMAEASAIVEANSGGVASLYAEYVDATLLGTAATYAEGQTQEGLSLIGRDAETVLSARVSLARYRHVVLLTRGKSGSWGQQPGRYIWQTKPDADTKWINGIAPALVHELGHNWGLSHTDTGLMSGAAGSNLWFSNEHRRSLGW